MRGLGWQVTPRSRTDLRGAGPGQSHRMLLSNKRSGNVLEPQAGQGLWVFIHIHTNSKGSLETCLGVPIPQFSLYV